MPTARPIIVCLSFALLVALTAFALAADRPRNSNSRSKPPATQPATQPAQWINIGKGIRARAFLGFWSGDNGRPGHAAKVVRLIPQSQSNNHFGFTLAVELPKDFTGDLRYKERLKLPQAPKTWTTDGGAGVVHEQGAIRTTSNDGRTTTVTETITYKTGTRQLAQQQIETDQTPFTTWDFAEGDPTGDWEMECWLNDQPLGKFSFKVVWGKPEDTDPVAEMDWDKEKTRP
jgi:hypothetical protein